jgi:lipoprotein-anchoring transpeptidase ErfK/SrfK
LHAISLAVIGFALAGSISSAAAQYLPAQPPPVSYSPPPAYPYPASPPPPYPGAHPYPDAGGVPHEDLYDRPYAPQPQPRIGDQQPYRPPGDIRSEPLPPPAVPPQDHGTALAALPPEYQPERGPAKALPPQFLRTVVDYQTVEPPGTIIIDTPNTYLYLTLGHGKAMRYGIGVGREGFTWSGSEPISQMKEWPDWLPPKEMIARQPYLPRFMAGGETNPLGARAMYLGNTEYRIHGTNQPSTIGSFVSSGCIRLANEDVEDLYSRVSVGTLVVVLPGANTAASQLRPRH